MGKFFKKLAGIDDKKREDKQEEILKQEITEELTNDKESEVEEINDELAEVDKDEEWLNEDYEEGQLSVDVYQTKDKLIVTSTIAGVKPEDIDISLNNDMLTIRGKREMHQEISDDDYLYRECYWGNFSRSIILPVEVRAEKIEASLENGVLTVTLPKAKTSKQISIKVKEK